MALMRGTDIGTKPVDNSALPEEEELGTLDKARKSFIETMWLSEGATRSQLVYRRIRRPVRVIFGIIALLVFLWHMFTRGFGDAIMAALAIGLFYVIAMAVISWIVVLLTRFFPFLFESAGKAKNAFDEFTGQK